MILSFLSTVIFSDDTATAAHRPAGPHPFLNSCAPQNYQRFYAGGDGESSRNASDLKELGV